jgi:excisionase family DNA binding protein
MLTPSNKPAGVPETLVSAPTNSRLFSPALMSAPTDDPRKGPKGDRGQKGEPGPPGPPCDDAHSGDRRAPIEFDRRHHVSFAEAAEYLGISVKTLERNYIHGGELPWYDFKGTRRIRYRDLTDYAAQHRIVGPRTKPPSDAT